ncbi:MAG TPA: hypothetical protein VK517_06070 [Cyclobacteriaceae bacterium]|nr:hypothetical protein [Cyclobacteriaceae bacterium]
MRNIEKLRLFLVVGFLVAAVLFLTSCFVRVPDRGGDRGGHGGHGYHHRGMGR